MNLVLFGTFIVIAFILIALGLIIREHSELALIGFVFLFLLSFVLINDNLEYKIGETIEDSYIYGDHYNASHYVDFNGSVMLGELNLFNKTQTISYNYVKYADPNSHNFGYWLAVISVFGFAGVLMGYRKSRRFS